MVNGSLNLATDKPPIPPLPPAPERQIRVNGTMKRGETLR